MNTTSLIACIQINLLRHPLLRVQTVQDCLDKTRQQVNAMIDSGELLFAFDLSANQKNRTDPRIFTLCVAECTGWKNPAGQTKNYKLHEVLRMILPPRDVRSTEMRRIFSCSSDHVYQLAKNFTIARKPTVNKGPNAFTVFHYVSVENFLERRRIT
jgi:hypothetical protein